MSTVPQPRVTLGSGSLKTALTFAVIKGGMLSTIVLAVVHSDLTPFFQALIIAVVSATIGFIGVVLAARIAAREAQREAEINRQMLRDLKNKVGADRRAEDQEEVETP